MNQFISFVFIVWALVASIHCGSYNYGDYVAPPSVYNVNSYSLGAAPSNYAAPAYQTYSYSSAVPSIPKYNTQALWSRELYPGRNNYKSYHSPPYYSQVTLPVVPSSPIAKLYVAPSRSYAAPAASYSDAY